MDNFLPLLDHPGFNPGMHFGKLLAQLREARGLTQSALAERARVALNTIQRGEDEQSERCPWKRSTATDVLIALERRAPLSEADASAYLQLAGLETLARMGREAIDRMARERDEAAAGVQRSSYAYSSAAEPRRSLAHTWLERMIEHVGEEQILAWLRASAPPMGVQLTPETKAGIWVHHSEEQDFGGGLRGRIHTPIDPAAPASIKATQSRRTSA